MCWPTCERLKFQNDWLMDVYGDGFSMMVAGFLKRYGNRYRPQGYPKLQLEGFEDASGYTDHERGRG